MKDAGKKSGPEKKENQKESANVWGDGAHLVWLLEDTTMPQVHHTASGKGISCTWPCCWYSLRTLHAPAIRMLKVTPSSAANVAGCLSFATLHWWLRAAIARAGTSRHPATRAPASAAPATSRACHGGWSLGAQAMCGMIKLNMCGYSLRKQVRDDAFLRL